MSRAKVKTGAGNVRRLLPSHVRDTRELVEGVWVQRMVVTCSTCGTGWPFPYWPQELFEKNLTQRGWSRAADPRRAVCAKCIAASAAKSEKEVIPMPKPSPAARESAPDPKLAVVALAEPPRTPTREDNRRIHDRIDEYWNGQMGCYKGVYSDAAIAEQLDMPRAWVAAVRDQFFGPDTNEEKRAAPAKLAEYEKRLKGAEDEMIRMASICEGLRNEVRAYIDSLGKVA